MRKSNWGLYLAILSFLLAVLWAGVSLVSNLRKSTIPADIQTIMSPLDPNLDTQFLTKIQSREAVE